MFWISLSVCKKRNVGGARNCVGPKNLIICFVISFLRFEHYTNSRWYVDLQTEWVEIVDTFLKYLGGNARQVM